MSAKRRPWQYGEGKYLSTVSINRNAVSSGPAVTAVREALGLGVGMFDEQLRRRVIEWQHEVGRQGTGVIVEDDWHALVNPEPEEPAEAPVEKPKRAPRKRAAKKAAAPKS